VLGGIVSLHDFRAQPLHRPAGRTTRAGAAPFMSDSGGNHYLAPSDFSTIYDLGSLYAGAIDGTGQSIAIVARSNIYLPDVETFRSGFGLPFNDPTIVLNGPDPGILSQNEEGEAVLDVEWSGAIAPKAAIQFVVSASTNATDGVTLSAQYIVNQNLAAVVSTSFGSCELSMGSSESQFWDSLWQQAAAEGMTVLVASGDSGVAGCDSAGAASASNPPGVNGLCSSPSSTCVGGTEFADAASASAYWTPSGSAIGYIPEAAWNESGAVLNGSGLWSTGGGASIYYPKPAWQTGPGVPSDGWRDVPDVALSAAVHDAYVTYMEGSYWIVGGTSAASPSFAGLMVWECQSHVVHSGRQSSRRGRRGFSRHHHRRQYRPGPYRL
jgi:subtilase family serine protease